VKFHEMVVTARRAIRQGDFTILEKAGKMGIIKQVECKK